MLKYYFLSFLSAFLIFQIELITGKILLPKCGGSFYIWTICLMFFQGILFLGYFYGYIFLRSLKYSFIKFFHIILIIASVFFLPDIIKINVSVISVNNLIIQLFLFISFPFFLLSTTQIIVQRSFSIKNNSDETHFLFSWSNFGALTSLISYPFLVEPFISVSVQIILWKTLYVLFLVIYFNIFIDIFSKTYINKLKNSEYIENNIIEEKSSYRKYFLLLILSASSCSLMVSTTNIITLDMSPIPFFWMLPLSIYLISFILNFKKTPFSRSSFLKVFIIYVIILFLVFLILAKDKPFYAPDIIKILILNLGVLFFFSMILNNYLYEIRPRKSENTPIYYLFISAGGFLGTIIITFVIPILFKNIGFSWVEYAFSFAFSFLSIFIYSSTKIKFLKLRRIIQFSGIIIISGVLLYSFWFLRKLSKSYVFSLKNFYGNYRVIDNPKRTLRTFLHSKTVHGIEYIDKFKKNIPLGYYGSRSPLKNIFDNFKKRKDIAVIGIGAGVIASYAKKNENWTFYEIDPDVILIAKKYFSFLKNCKASYKIKVGDGRIELSKEKNKFDIIVIDVYSSDAIPFHILTKQAFKIYDDHLKKDGVIVFNISNMFFNYDKIIYSTMPLKFKFLKRSSNILNGRIDNEFESKWCLLTENIELYNKLKYFNWKDMNNIPKNEAWTDDFSSVFPYLKLK